MSRNLIVLLVLTAVLQAQDFQVKLHEPYTLPTLPDSLTLAEFQVLNHDLGWKELFTAIIFPGYASRYALEDTAAAKIAFGRYLGLTAVGIVALNTFFNPDVEAANFQQLVDNSNVNAAVFMAGISTNIILTIFDWGYANLRLKQKQDRILFKYRKKPDLRSVDILNGLKKIHLP